MSNPDPAIEPSMEEILASIRQIIAEGDEPASGGAAAAAQPGSPRPAAEAAKAQPEPQPQPPEPESEPEPQPPEEDPYALAAGQAAAPAAAPAPEEPAADDEDVFDLTDDMMAGAEPPSNAIPFPQPAAPEMPAEEPPAMPDPAAIAAAAAASPEPAGLDDEIEFRSPTPPPAEEASQAAAAASAASATAQPQQAAGEGEEGEDPLLSAAAGQAVAEAFGRLTQRSPTADSRTIEELVVDMLRPMLKEWLEDNLPMLVERMVRDEIERVTRGRR